MAPQAAFPVMILSSILFHRKFTELSSGMPGSEKRMNCLSYALRLQSSGHPQVQGPLKYKIVQSKARTPSPLLHLTSHLVLGEAVSVS